LTMVRGGRWDDAMGRGRGDARVGAFAVETGRRGATRRAREWMDASLGLPVDRSIDREAWTSRGGAREDGSERDGSVECVLEARDRWDRSRGRVASRVKADWDAARTMDGMA